MGLIGPDRLVLNQLPSNTTLWAYDTDGPGPHDCNFRRRCPPKFLKAPDSCGDLCRRVKERGLAVSANQRFVTEREIRVPEWIASCPKEFDSDLV